MGRRTILASGKLNENLSYDYANHQQVGVSDTQTFGAMIETLETVSRLITRYAMFEELYLQRASSVRAELLEALTILYTEILTVLANANKYFRTSTLSK